MNGQGFLYKQRCWSDTLWLRGWVVSWNKIVSYLQLTMYCNVKVRDWAVTVCTYLQLSMFSKVTTIDSLVSCLQLIRCPQWWMGPLSQTVWRMEDSRRCSVKDPCAGAWTTLGSWNHAPWEWANHLATNQVYILTGGVKW